MGILVVEASASSGTADTSAIETRLLVLEDKNVITTRFASISAATGTVTPPTNATIRLDDFGGTVDAVVSALDTRPTFQPVYSAAGAVVGASFDSGGVYSLSAAPSSYPVALLYRVTQKAKHFDSTAADIVGESETDGGSVRPLEAFIEVPLAKTYTLMQKAQQPFTIYGLDAIMASGTCTASVLINSTAVTGLDALSLGTAATGFDSSGASVVSAGDSVKLAIASPSGTQDLSVTIRMAS